MTALVLDEMPAAMDLDVTLKVDVKSGYSWGISDSFDDA